MSDERRVTNPVTGGEKGTKLARFDLIPAGALTQLAEHYGKGAEKYTKRGECDCHMNVRPKGAVGTATKNDSGSATPSTPMPSTEKEHSPTCASRQVVSEGDNNWRRGYDWSLSFAAMQRHAWAFWNGEDLDPETGSHHLAAVAFHAFSLMTFCDEHKDLDNRWRAKREPQRESLPFATGISSSVLAHERELTRQLNRRKTLGTNT